MAVPYEDYKSPLTSFSENISFGPPHPDGLFAQVKNVGDGIYINLYHSYFQRPTIFWIERFKKIISKESEIREKIEKCEAVLKENESVGRENKKSRLFKEEIKVDEGPYKIIIKEMDMKTYVDLYYEGCVMKKDLFLQMLDKIPEILQAVERCGQKLQKEKIENVVI